jgi:hypothetical protein
MRFRTAHRSSFVFVFVMSCALMLNPDEAIAQNGGWEVEIHGGGAISTNASGGTTTRPGSTALATPFAQFPSRRHSTWFAGDGAALANDVAGKVFVGTPSQIDSRITPLDAILNRPFAERGGGGSFGFRVSRTLTPRFAAEFNVDYAASSLRVPSAVTTGVQSAATSFQAIFTEYMAPLLDPAFPEVTAPVTATGSVDEGESGGQIIATGALNINLARTGRILPYATVGAGIISEGGDAPTAALNGQYGVRAFGFTFIEEMDRVTLTYDADDRMVVGVFGGGAKIALSPRAGIRIDARIHVGSRTVRTLMDANPSVRTAIPELSDVVLTLTNPSIVFSNNAAMFNFASSLSGPALNDAVVYAVDGTVVQAMVSGGYYFRF